MPFAAMEQRTADDSRQGTTNLVAAWNIMTGEVLGRCCRRRRAREFLMFLGQVVPACEGRSIHVVFDNLSAHSDSDVDRLLVRDANVTVHVTPAGGSWLN